MEKYKEVFHLEQLKDHAAVKEMLRLMEENGRQEQAAELARLIAAADSIIQQYDPICAKLDEIRQQLADLPKPRHPVRDAISQTVQKVEYGATEALTWILTVREHIISCAETAVADFKREGVSALDKAVSALNVQYLLETMQEKIGASLDRVAESIHKVEAMGQELRNAGGHLKNAGRAAAGKEARQIDGGQEGRFQAAVLAPLRAVHSMLGGLDRTAYAALGAVDRLSRAAEQGRGKREKSSVRQRLGKKPPALPAPAPAKNPREAER